MAAAATKGERVGMTETSRERESATGNRGGVEASACRLERSQPSIQRTPYRCHQMEQDNVGAKVEVGPSQYRLKQAKLALQRDVDEDEEAENLQQKPHEDPGFFQSRRTETVTPGQRKESGLNMHCTLRRRQPDGSDSSGKDRKYPSRQKSHPKPGQQAALSLIETFDVAFGVGECNCKRGKKKIKVFFFLIWHFFHDCDNKLEIIGVLVSTFKCSLNY